MRCATPRCCNGDVAFLVLCGPSVRSLRETFFVARSVLGLLVVVAVVVSFVLTLCAFDNELDSLDACRDSLKSIRIYRSTAIDVGNLCKLDEVRQRESIKFFVAD